MIVTTWNNGNYNTSGAGYGVKISKKDRQKFFDKAWDSVVIGISDFKNSKEIHLHDTFWTTCSELRSAKIGKYLIDNGLGKWEKRKPYKLLLFPQVDNKFILIISNPIELATWAGGSTFKYDGSVKIGTRIYFGESGVVEISKLQYQALLKEYTGMTIDVGTSRDKAPIHSLGHWLQKYVTKTAIASYVSNILIQEGYAKKIEKSIIKFS
ncbi:hypothetical protein ACFIJ5_09555 [Haloimpatiens sp. FM7330]|uniref:hypothetical protein n=1 Tax=Haloimpatiens sp. FM7330 TaxID=3298610 RepID=UPI003628E77A